LSHPNDPAEKLVSPALHSDRLTNLMLAPSADSCAPPRDVVSARRGKAQLVGAGDIANAQWKGDADSLVRAPRGDRIGFHQCYEVPGNQFLVLSESNSRP